MIARVTNDEMARGMGKETKDWIQEAVVSHPCDVRSEIPITVGHSQLKTHVTSEKRMLLVYRALPSSSQLQHLKTDSVISARLLEEDKKALKKSTS